MSNGDNRLGFIASWTSFILNIILFLLKLWIGILCGSIAMVADAWHTLSDTITSAVVIVGLWVSGRPADKKHPFGHGRFEYIAAIIIGILLANVGIKFLIDSVGRLRHYEEVGFSMSAVVIFAISIVVKEGLARFAFWVADKMKSESVRADGWHHRSDAIASALILIGIFAGKYFWWIDGVLGIAVSLLILKAAFDIIRIDASVLMGESPDDALMKKVNEIVGRCDHRITGPHHYHVHKYGGHMELTLHVRLPSEIHLSESEKIVSGLEREISESLSVEVTIHADPT